MGTRRNPVDEAARHADRQLRAARDDLRNARLAAGLSQRSVGRAVGRSRQEIGAIERGELVDIGLVQLARLAAAVGLDVPIRTFAGGSPLRDAAQLSLLERFRVAIGPSLPWRTEVPVSRDPLDRRAFDAVLALGRTSVGVEAITRLTDLQAQIRAITLKQATAGFASVVLVLADTRHNRRAVHDGETTLGAAFPLPPRIVLAALRAGTPPSGNGYVLA